MDLALSQRRHNPVDSICRKLKTIQRRDQEADTSPFHIPRFQSSSYDSPQPGLRCNLEAILKKRAMRSDHPDTPAVFTSVGSLSTSSASSSLAAAAVSGMVTPTGSPGRPQGRRLTLGASGASPLVTPRPANATYTITSTVLERRSSFGTGQKRGGGWQRTCSTPATTPSETDGYFTFGRDTPYGQPETGEATPRAGGEGEKKERRRSPAHSLMSYNLNFCSSDTSTLLDADLAYPALVVKRLSLGGEGTLTSSERRKETMAEVSLICEEDLLDTIFHACDTQRRGKVYVSRIVDYLRHTTSRSSEDSGLEELCNMLDPERKDISIDLDTYHAVMKEWIEDCRNHEDDTAENITQESVKALDSLAARRSALLNMTSGSLEAIGGETSRNDLETSDLIYCVADLQCTNQKLQEEMRKLKQAMEMMDDANQRLVEENEDLKAQAKAGQQLLQKEKMLKEEVEEMKLTLSSSEEGRARASAQTKQMERENQSLISKITALQEENIRAAVEMDDLQKKMGELCDLNADLQVKVHSFDAVLREKDSVIFERNREIQDLKTAVVEYCSVTEILRADKTKLENQMQMMHPDITASGLSLSVAYRLNQTSLGSLQTELALAQSPLEGGERFSSSMCVASPLDETLDREVLLLMQGPTPEQQSLEHRALIRTLRKEFQEDSYTVQSALRNLSAKHDGQEISTSQKLQVELEQRRRDWAQTLDQLQQYTDSLEKELLKMASNMRRSRTEILHLSVRVQEQENQKQQLKDELEHLKTPQDSREASCQTPDVPQVEEDPDGPSLEWEEEYVIPESPLAPPLCRPGNGTLLPLGGNPASPATKETHGDEQRGGQLNSGVEEEETPQGESPESSERGRDTDTTGLAEPQKEAVTASSRAQEGAGVPECIGAENAHKQTACAEQRDPASPQPPTHTPAAGPVPSESSEDVPASQPLPTQASPARGKMVSPSSTPAELGDTTSLSPRCAAPTSGDSSPGGDEAIAMNLNDSQKLCAQIPDSLGALESHRSSLLPVAEEEEMTVESATDAVDMAGTHPERSDVTTATSGVNGCPADSPNKADREGSNTTSDTAGPPGSSRAGADTRLSPPGGDRDALQDKQQKGLEKEQSMEALEGQKGREDSEGSAATEKEGEGSMVSEDTSEQDDRRNSWSLSASEKEVETEFHRLSLSFKCDMYTLEKRLRLEERSRDLAEENVRKEVASCQGLLQALSPLCEDDSQSVEIIQRLQKNLDILIQAMVRVSSRSETLGAIHQESRVGKAVEVMIQHVENLRRTYTKEHAELMELRESVSNSERSFGPHTDRDELSRLKKQSGSQYYKQSSSRRVSIAVIPRSGGAGLDMSKSPDSGEVETDRLSRRSPWQSQTPSPTHSKEQTTPPSHTPEPRTTTYPSTSTSSYLSTWRAGLGLGRGLWVWVLVLVVLACLLGLLASLLLQPAADAAPVGTGDSWMTIQQLLWPYASLRHNGQPPV